MKIDFGCNSNGFIFVTLMMYMTAPGFFFVSSSVIFAP